MGLKPSRAWVCIQETNQQIHKRLSSLLMKTISAHLSPILEEQARAEQEILLKAQAALASIAGDWNRVLSFHKPLSFASVSFVSTVSSGAAFDNVVMEHLPVLESLGDLKVSQRDGLFFFRGKWDYVEEISNVAQLCFTARTKLMSWLESLRTGPTWDDATLSRVCAISPSYRACLVNKGRRYLQIDPATITVFKHGPRGLNFKPMEPLLARALQVAANLPEVEK